MLQRLSFCKVVMPVARNVWEQLEGRQPPSLALNFRIGWLTVNTVGRPEEAVSTDAHPSEFHDPRKPP